jgi:hypothetical protein
MVSAKLPQLLIGLVFWLPGHAERTQELSVPQPSHRSVFLPAQSGEPKTCLISSTRNYHVLLPDCSDG